MAAILQKNGGGTETERLESGKAAIGRKRKATKGNLR